MWCISYMARYGRALPTMAPERGTTVSSGADTGQTVASLTHWLQARAARSPPLVWLRHHA
jgi:hypothetical protein